MKQYDDQKFCKFVKDISEKYHLDDKEIAQELTISITSVRRWKAGINAPHPIMRKHVIKILVALARYNRVR